MSLSQEELAKRLKNGREALGLTQEQASKEIGISRTALALVETAKRKVDTLELARMVEVYELSLPELLDAGREPSDPVQVLLRASATLEESPEVKRGVRHACKLVKDIDFYDSLAGGQSAGLGFAGFRVESPASKGEAIEQGITLAAKERARLGLGTQPVWGLADILRREGARIAELAMPKQLSGLTLRLPEGGVLIAVRKDDPAERRLFSYAHEWCHAVADQERPAVVSEDGNKDPIETRADVFAANFLMPAEGVSEFLRSALGKEYDGKLEEKHWPEVARMAKYFGVSFQAAGYRLNNLGQISSEVCTKWQAVKHPAREFKKSLKGPELRESSFADLGSQLVEAALRAFRSEKISRGKFMELCREGGLKDEHEIEDLVYSVPGYPKAVGAKGSR